MATCRVMVWQQDEQFLAVCPRFGLVRYAADADLAVRAIEAAIMTGATDPEPDSETYQEHELEALRQTNGGPQFVREIEIP